MILSRVAAWCAVLVAAATPWAFGAADPSWAALMAACILVSAAVAWTAEALRGDAPGLPRTTLIVLASLPAVAAATLVPLPGWVRAVAAPWGSSLREIAAPGASGTWLPLSLAPHATIAATALAAAYASAFVLLHHEARRPGGRTLLASALVLSGVALAVEGAAQYLTQRDMLQPKIYWSIEVYEAGTPFGPYVNRNHFAGAMVLLASVAAGECLAARAAGRRAAATVWGAGLLAMLVALTLTKSRGGALAAASGFAFLVATTPSGRRARAVLTGVAVAGVVAAALAFTGVLDEFAGRMFDLYGRWMNRFAVQRDALAAFAGNPLAGTGAGTFEDVYPAFQRVCDERSFQNAHSDWVQILMETGLLGAAAAIAAVRWFRGRVRAGLGLDGPDRWRVLGPAAGVVGIAVHGFFEVNLHIPANALLTACALSLASSAAAEPGSAAPDRARE